MKMIALKQKNVPAKASCSPIFIDGIVQFLTHFAPKGKVGGAALGKRNIFYPIVKISYTVF
jgi:hypothetical protein